MTPQTAEGLDEKTDISLNVREPTYHDYLKGERGETTLTYVVPQEGINAQVGLAIAQRTGVYEFTQQICGIGRGRHIGVLRPHVTRGVFGFTATEYRKFAQLSPGEQVVFRINAAGDLERAALSEIKALLENAAKGKYSLL